jgi:hypothetical protein
MASASSSAFDHRPGRAAGNSINALLDAWQLTSEAKYLRYAELLIRRCVHPRQDIDSLSLLDAEKHWSYTIFLVSLDKYLVAKLAAGEVDDNYQYARSTMVHYGCWMAANERPYLDRPEELEFPTEAWAAQEVRKANVLRLAAKYASGDFAISMRKRGQELAERAWSDLWSFSTRTTARAMAVLFVEGLRDAELRQPQPTLCEPMIAGNHEMFPDHTDFQTQRERVKRQLRSPVGIALLLARAAAPSRWPRILNHI